MKKHFLLTCMSYLFFGFGMAVQQFGIKAGLSLEAVLIIWLGSVAFLITIAFTSMQKVKDVLFKKPEHKFYFEKDVPRDTVSE